jgi:MFS family permease
MFWGFGCDVFGRRWAFNLTLGVTAVFGLAAAGSPNFAAIGCFAALWSFGVGGNLPVDSAVFLEFLPGSHQYLLTILSVDWAIAQVIANLIAWPILGNLTCQEDTVCHRSENMGWRYFVVAMGGISMVEFFIRFACFTVFESPKYLMGKGLDEEAVRIVHEVARRNGKTSNRKQGSSIRDHFLTGNSDFRRSEILRDTRIAPANRRNSGTETKIREIESHSRASSLCVKKTGFLYLIDNAYLGVHWTRLPSLQRFPTVHPSHAWGQIR